MNQLAKAALLICIIVFGASFFFINRLPPKNQILQELYNNPVQADTYETPFEITRKDITYKITPLYDYEMYGLVVSHHNSSSWLDISHEDWKDYLNTKDISTIWGKNIETGDYLKMKFYHGDWTGYYKFYGPVAFTNSCFGNTHLLTDNENIEKQIMRTRTGDQVYAKGYLVNYSHTNGKFVRSSSTTRDDTGNGACEILFVTDYKILKSANQNWKTLRNLSKILGGICILYFAFSIFFV